MNNKINFKNIALSIAAILGLLFVVLVDSSSVVTEDLQNQTSEILTNSDKYLLPEAKLFLEFVGNIFDLITNA